MSVCRLVLGLLYILFVWYLPAMRLADGNFPAYFYILLTVTAAVHQVSVIFYTLSAKCVTNYRSEISHRKNFNADIVK